MLQRTFPAGFIAPCLPTKTDKLPSGNLWLHEIKHDGFRVIARKDGDRVRLYSRPGNDFTRRFPLIVEALVRLRSRSCTIDGEAVSCGENGIASLQQMKSLRARKTHCTPPPPRRKNILLRSAWFARCFAFKILSTNAAAWRLRRLFKSAIADGPRERRVIAEPCRECRSVEALAPVRNAACDHEHRADMKMKQPTARQ
jgi:ATP dependent DNA ligase domain